VLFKGWIAVNCIKALKNTSAMWSTAIMAAFVVFHATVWPLAVAIKSSTFQFGARSLFQTIFVKNIFTLYNEK
jgi:hypothetical protein